MCGFELAGRHAARALLVPGWAFSVAAAPRDRKVGVARRIGELWGLGELERVGGVERI